MLIVRMIIKRCKCLFALLISECVGNENRTARCPFWVSNSKSIPLKIKTGNRLYIAVPRVFTPDIITFPI